MQQISVHQEDRTSFESSVTDRGEEPQFFRSSYYVLPTTVLRYPQYTVVLEPLHICIPLAQKKEKIPEHELPVSANSQPRQRIHHTHLAKLNFHTGTR